MYFPFVALDLVIVFFDKVKLPFFNEIDPPLTAVLLLKLLFTIFVLSFTSIAPPFAFAMLESKVFPVISVNFDPSIDIAPPFDDALLFLKVFPEILIFAPLFALIAIAPPFDAILLINLEFIPVMILPVWN